MIGICSGNVGRIIHPRSLECNSRIQEWGAKSCSHSAVLNDISIPDFASHGDFRKLKRRPKAIDEVIASDCFPNSRKRQSCIACLMSDVLRVNIVGQGGEAAEMMVRMCSGELQAIATDRHSDSANEWRPASDP